MYYYEREWPLFRLQNETCEKTYDKTIPKPTKASGIRWIDHRWRAMEILFKNNNACISHLNQRYFTDSQALKQVEIKTYAKNGNMHLYYKYCNISQCIKSC